MLLRMLKALANEEIATAGCFAGRFENIAAIKNHPSLNRWLHDKTISFNACAHGAHFCTSS